VTTFGAVEAVFQNCENLVPASWAMEVDMNLRHRAHSDPHALGHGRLLPQMSAAAQLGFYRISDALEGRRKLHLQWELDHGCMAH
jgi:hypothetical protein